MNNKKPFCKTRLIGLVTGLGLLGTLTGCVGWVDGGGYYEGGVVAPEPDFYLFGGSYGRVHDVHVYSHRGAVSRRTVHPGGGHPGGGHPGGGHPGGGHPGGGHPGGGHPGGGRKH